MLILLRFTSGPEFSSVMETLKNICDWKIMPEGEHVMACSYGEVGVTKLTVDRNCRLTGWSFLIPLDYFCEPANAVHLQWITPAFLFGRLINARNSIETILSMFKKENLQLKFSITSVL